ncbi:hypothetical protein DFJ73DRAFT_839073 [Zopfochytrium polystomum]|nr:hypothetical protein DFJ73DRAFT_839073 [Zopfochytrium polystomum]
MDAGAAAYRPRPAPARSKRPPGLLGATRRRTAGRRGPTPLGVSKRGAFAPDLHENVKSAVGVVAPRNDRRVAATGRLMVARSSVVRRCVDFGWCRVLVFVGDASRTCLRHWPPVAGPENGDAEVAVHAAVRPCDLCACDDDLAGGQWNIPGFRLTRSNRCEEFSVRLLQNLTSYASASSTASSPSRLATGLTPWYEGTERPHVQDFRCEWRTTRVSDCRDSQSV